MRANGTEVFGDKKVWKIEEIDLKFQPRKLTRSTALIRFYTTQTHIHTPGQILKEDRDKIYK